MTISIMKRYVLGCFVVFCMVLINRYFMTDVLTRSTREVFTQLRSKLHKRDGSNVKPYLIPRDDVLRNLSKTELIRIYWRYIRTLQVLCRNQSRLGSLRDGGKEVCLDGNIMPKQPCIVYSFGSKFQFDFDVTANKYLGCEVFTFDPTLDVRGKRIPQEVKFIEVGLAGRDHTTANKWKMKTLKSIIRDCHHEDTVIDIVKIDIDGYEYSSLTNIIKTGVHRQIKQLLLEVHFGRAYANPKGPYWGNVGFAEQLRVLRLLYEAGFRIFMRDPVLSYLIKADAPPQNNISPQMEISLINMAYLDD